jgi:hypothetical protein
MQVEKYRRKSRTRSKNELPEDNIDELPSELLLRLVQLRQSTDRGMVDKGFVTLNRRLAVHMLAEEKNDGWIITPAGRMVLSAEKDRLRSL